MSEKIDAPFETDLDSEQDAPRLANAEAVRFVIAALLPTAVALIAAATGFAPIVSGSRGATALLLLPIFLGVFHAAAVWPLKHAHWLPTSEHPERLLGAVLLSAIPLLSFTYFLGNFRDATQAWDAVMAVIPPLAVGWLAFRRTDREVWFAALAGGTSFLALFIFNDAFGPFRTVVACAPFGQLFHSLRTMAAFGGIALVAFSTAPRPARVRSGLAFLAVFSIALDFVLPAFLAAFGVDEIVKPTYEWIGFTAALYFLFRPTPFARKAFVAIAGLEALAIAFRLALHIAAPSSGVAAQAQLALETLAFGYFAAVLVRAWNERGEYRLAPSGLTSSSGR